MSFTWLGYCSKCGDTNGPWGWIDGKWMCENCMKEKKENEEKKKNIQRDKYVPGKKRNESK